MDSSLTPPQAGLADRLLAIRRRLARPADPRLRRAVLAAVLLVFLGGALWSVRALSLEPRSLRWLPLAVVGLALVPLTALLNALEFKVSGLVLGQRVPLGEALRVVLAATAANLLPLPGAAIVRIGKLSGMGAKASGAVASTMSMGFVWLGIAAAIAGGALLWLRSTPAALLFLAGAAASGAAAAALVRREVPEGGRRRRLLLMAAGVESLFVLLGALRIHLVLLGLGAAVTPAMALVLNVSGALASTVGVFPGGLGLREGIAAALAPLVGLQPAHGFLSGALNRILGLAGSALLVAGLLLVPGRERR